MSGVNGKRMNEEQLRALNSVTPEAAAKYLGGISGGEIRAWLERGCCFGWCTVDPKNKRRRCYINREALILYEKGYIPDKPHFSVCEGRVISYDGEPSDLGTVLSFYQRFKDISPEGAVCG